MSALVSPHGSDRAWRLSVYDAPPASGPLVVTGPACRFVYALAGEVTLEAGEDSTRIEPDDGRFTTAPFTLRGTGQAWIYELLPAGGALLAEASIVLSHIVRPGFDGPLLVRADRIESPPGAVTPRHGHRGPGIRRLLKGTLRAEVGETIERIEAGDAWFETGRDPVVGTNIGETNAAFVRVMLLPRELEGGKSSFVPSDPAEAAKPRAVASRLFGEILLE
jgi:quercetin dioxygenase-like cupin family protein